LHAATSTLESNIAIYYNTTVVPLSRSVIARCMFYGLASGGYTVPSYLTACNGGVTSIVFQKAMTMFGGLVPEATYPFSVYTNQSIVGGTVVNAGTYLSTDYSTSTGKIISNGGCNSNYATSSSTAQGLYYPYNTARWGGLRSLSSSEDWLMYAVQQGPVRCFSFPFHVAAH
jgi:hypothetical protein